MPAENRLLRFARAHLWIVPILLLALWMRLASLGEEHLYGDEAEYAIVARYLSRDIDFLAYPDITGLGAVPFVSQPPLILYTMALSMKIFGANDFGALLPSILYGVATVAAVYAIGHRLGGRLMGLGAAGVLAVLPFHVEMSRRAMLDSGYVFFLMLTAYFCVAWLQDRKTHQAVGIGIGVACAALAKLPGVLTGPIALLVLLVGLAATLARRDREEMRATLKQAGLAMIPVGVGAFLYLALLAKLNAIQNLMVKLVWQVGRVDTSQAQFREIAAMDRAASWYFTDPEFGLRENLLPIVFALALVGCFVLAARAALRSFRPEDAVVPIFLAVILGFFMWSDRKEGFYMLPVAPLAALLIAYAGDGLRRMLRWAGLRFAPARGPAIGAGAMAVGILLVSVPAYAAASETMDDFIRGNDQEKYFGFGTQEAAAFIRERDPEAGQHGTLLGRFALHWYNEQDTYHWYVDHTFIHSAVRSGDLKYIVYEDYLQLAFDREYMRQLIDAYDGQAIKTFRAGWGEVTVFELNPS